MVSKATADPGGPVSRPCSKAPMYTSIPRRTSMRPGIPKSGSANETLAKCSHSGDRLCWEITSHPRNDDSRDGKTHIKITNGRDCKLSHRIAVRAIG